MNKTEANSRLLTILNNSEADAALADVFIDAALDRLDHHPDFAALYLDKSATFTAADLSGSKITLPGDLKRLHRITNTYGANEYEVIRTTWDRLADYRDANGHPPRYFALYGSEIEIRPTIRENDLIELRYRKRLDRTSTPDWGVHSPYLVIYSALTFAADHFLDERREVWAQRSEQLREELYVDYTSYMQAAQSWEPSSPYLGGF